MGTAEPKGYEFKFNGCYYWTVQTCGGPVHYRELYIMGERVKEVPSERLMASEYENAKAQGMAL